MSSVAFSSTGANTSGYPKDDNLQTKMRGTFKFTVVASETVTITHGSDDEGIRDVRVYTSAGVLVAEGGALLTSVTRTAATTTTLVFAAGGAGTYSAAIEW